VTSFGVQLNERRFRPGEIIRGRAVVEQAARSRGLEAKLELTEQTRDYTRVAFSAGTGKLSEGDLQPGAAYDFWFQLPADAVPSIDVGVGRLSWRVRVQSDRVGPDETAEAIIQVT